jgi:prolipoprotein diacylglyceryltransferase
MAVGFAVMAGKSLRLAVKAWLGFVIITLFPFTAFISILPTMYQILSITLIALTLSLLVYVYSKRRRTRLHNVTST